MVNPLEALDIVFAYPGPVEALRGASLAIHGGELLVVVGPNGSGKSTLLRCLAGLATPQRGEVLLCGTPYSALSPRQRALAVAVVPQFLPSLPDVLVIDFVLGGRYAHLERLRGPAPHDLDVAHRALVDCDADDVARRRMDELSGGQRQRVLIARALAQEAGVLLVDEPTNSLDPEHQVRVFALLHQLAKGGKAVVVVTHDLVLCGQFADRLVLMAAGRVHVDGKVESVLRPEVLGPVYGPHLSFGRLMGSDGRERPYALPWLRS